MCATSRIKQQKSAEISIRLIADHHHDNMSHQPIFFVATQSFEWFGFNIDDIGQDDAWGLAVPKGGGRTGISADPNESMGICLGRWLLARCALELGVHGEVLSLGFQGSLDVLAETPTPPTSARTAAAASAAVWPLLLAVSKTFMPSWSQLSSVASASVIGSKDSGLPSCGGAFSLFGAGNPHWACLLSACC